MDYIAALEKYPHKETVDQIVAHIGGDSKRFDQLMQGFLTGDKRVNQRTSWVMSSAVENHPELIIPYYDFLMEKLRDPQSHDALKRNITRILQFVDVPEKHQGIVYDRCIQLLSSPKEAIAIRVFAMTAAFRIGQKHPDLLIELEAVIRDVLPKGSAGLKSRGQKTLQAISKFKKQII